MNMDAFVFYRSFYEAIRHLPDKADKADIYEAIASYALDGVEPQLTGTSAAIFTIVKPFLDKNIQRSINGRKGGRPKQTKTKTKPNANQNETEVKPSENQSAKKANLINNKEINNKEINNILIHSEDKSSSCISAKRQQYDITFGYETDSKLHGITQELIALWQSQFPAVDVIQELRNAENWLDCNRSQRKYDIKRFLGNWLRRTQDRAKAPASRPQQYNTYSKFDGNTQPSVSESERALHDGF